MDSSLATRRTVAELVAVWNQCVVDIRSAFAALVGVEQRLTSAFGGDYRLLHVRPHRYRCDGGMWDEPEAAIEHLKRECWGAIVERLEVRRCLSIARSKALDEQLERGELPDITEANIYAFAKGYADQIDAMLAEAVTEVFEWLRPHCSTYKTNTELEVGRRVILSYVVDTGWTGRFRVNYHRHAHLAALENVFTMLDGQGVVSKSHRSVLHDAIEAAPDGRGETPLFRFRAFKNGNLHLEFKRADLLARFNQIAGGNRLRPSTEAA